MMRDMAIPVTVVRFKDRSDRARYVVQQFSHRLKGRMLDVGCDRALIHELRPDLDYTGIDIGGTPTIQINLDQTPALPFDDDAFDCIVCTDVLEHLEHLHRTFEQIVRVLRPGGVAIISLPNCWNNLRRRIRRGKGTPWHYGLPPEPPPDRHRWFMNVDDIVGFMQAQESRLPVRIAEQFANQNPRSFRWVGRVLYPSPRRYLNRYAHSVWTVLEKTQA
jgi:SAM-dependent methyltransferase